MKRDFTYIDDVAEAMRHIVDSPAPYTTQSRIYNVGNNKPEARLDFVTTLEQKLELEADVTWYREFYRD